MQLKTPINSSILSTKYQFPSSSLHKSIFAISENFLFVEVEIDTVSPYKLRKVKILENMWLGLCNFGNMVIKVNCCKLEGIQSFATQFSIHQLNVIN